MTYKVWSFACSGALYLSCGRVSFHLGFKTRYWLRYTNGENQQAYVEWIITFISLCCCWWKGIVIVVADGLVKLASCRDSLLMSAWLGLALYVKMVFNFIVGRWFKNSSSENDVFLFLIGQKRCFMTPGNLVGVIWKWVCRRWMK